MKKWAVGGALASERSRGLSGPQSEPGMQSHGRVHARETEDEGRTGSRGAAGAPGRQVQADSSLVAWASARTLPALLPSPQTGRDRGCPGRCREAGRGLRATGSATLSHATRGACSIDRGRCRPSGAIAMLPSVSSLRASSRSLPPLPRPRL